MGKGSRYSPIDRRQFLGRMSGGALGAGLGLSLMRQGVAGESPQPQLERRNEQAGMVYRPFGKTNLNVSRLSFGCIQLTDDRLPAMEMAIERGVNVVHIAGGYVKGQAILSLGKFLKRPSNREKVWVMLKGIHDVDNDLRKLNTDHVDVVCVPVMRRDLVLSEEYLKRFEGLRKAGKVRFSNLTTHESLKESAEAALDAGWYQTLLVAMGLSSLGELKATLQRANQLNVGVMAMKSLRGKGDLKEIASTLFASGVTTILKTLNTPEDVERWFDAVTKAPQQMAELPTDCGIAGPGALCTLCGACEKCPNGVAIQSVVLNYTYYYQNLGLRDLAAERYAEIASTQTALACADCGRCEARCPKAIPVRRLIREAHEILTA